MVNYKVDSDNFYFGQGSPPTHRHVLAGVVTVDGIPAQKRIWVLNRVTMERFAVTESDPVTGEWQISHIPEQPENSLLVIVFDDEGINNALIYDYVNQGTTLTSIM